MSLKKTIELPQEIQRSLTQISQQTGRSEAELIRAAIEEYLAQQQTAIDRSMAQQALVRLREIGRRMPLVDAVQLARESREDLEQRGVH